MTTWRCACGHLVTLPAGEAPRHLAHSRAWAPGDGELEPKDHDGPWSEEDARQMGMFE
jgi:hypothetical protein